MTETLQMLALMAFACSCSFAVASAWYWAMPIT